MISPPANGRGRAEQGPQRPRGKEGLSAMLNPTREQYVIAASFDHFRTNLPWSLKQQPKKRESIIGSSIGFLGGIFSRLLGGSRNQDSESESEENASSPMRVCFTSILLSFYIATYTKIQDIADSDEEKKYKYSKKDKRETDKENIDVNKRVNFADDYNHKRGDIQDGPSGDQLKAAILNKPALSQEEYLSYNYGA